MALLLVASALLLALHAVTPAAADYGYVTGSDTAPEKWGEMSPQWALCGIGNMQSPIDIPLGQNYLPLGPLNSNYPVSDSKPATFVLEHHYGKLELDASWGTLEIGQVSYYTENIHIHAPSEHTIGGIRYPLEIHIVHKTADGQGVAVVGVLFAEGAANNKFLDQFFNYLPNFYNDPQARIPIDSLSAQDLKISYDSAYWRYSGSLTTPPCTEGVTWTLLKEIATVSQFQLWLYKRYRPASNARPIQAFNARRIASYL